MKEIVGDIIKYCEDNHSLHENLYVVHGCNCLNIMGAGLAKQLVTKYPALSLADSSYVEKNKYMKLGNFTELNMSTFSIINLYTQFRLRSSTNRKPLDYEALQLGLRKLNLYLYDKHCGNFTIVLPHIGCGLAGGEWVFVKDIIEKTLTHGNVIIVNK